METKVVNLRREPYDVYIGRAGRGENGYFGNPIVVGRVCHSCRNIHTRAGDTIRCYREYFYRRVARDVAFRKAVVQLKGKTLGCFCKPNPCHGDVIKEWLDSLRY